jgi:hypothetical protein
MSFSGTRPDHHGVLTDFPTKPPRLGHPGAQLGKTGITRGTSSPAEPGSGTKLLRVPTHCRLSDENSRGKVQNVCGDSSAEFLSILAEAGVASVTLPPRSPNLKIPAEFHRGSVEGNTICTDEQRKLQVISRPFSADSTMNMSGIKWLRRQHVPFSVRTLVSQGEKLSRRISIRPPCSLNSKTMSSR